MNRNKNTEKSIPVILVGCGAVGRFFYTPAIKILSEHGELYLQALVDPVKENIETLAKEFPESILADDISKVDISNENLVIIASPHRCHAPQSIYALEKGASVLCEKPMAASTFEAKAMIKAEQSSDGIMAVGLCRRFYPATLVIKNIIKKRILGSLKRFTIREGNASEWQAASDSFFNSATASGGVFFDVGVHVLDQLIMWLGEPVDFIYEDDAMDGLDINARVYLTYPGGVKGEIRLSKDWENENFHTFYFEKGIVRWAVGNANGLQISMHGQNMLLSGTLKDYSLISNDVIEGEIMRSDPQCFIEQLRNVTASMRGEESLRVPSREGIRSLHLIEKCYVQKRLIEMPWLTPQEVDEARRLAAVNKDIN